MWKLKEDTLVEMGRDNKIKIGGRYGFSRLSMFNDSLLAKQTWRSLKNPDSLFSKVFKAKFYPNCSIFEAKDSRLASYAWWSILKGDKPKTN